MPSPLPTAASAGPMFSILAVDDDQDIVDLLAILLEGAGHRVHGFTSSRDALDFARLHRIDAAILDVNMPPPDGIELAQLLQADPRTCLVRIAFHTSWPEDIVRAAFEGTALHLMKPASGDTIVAGVERLMHA